MGRLQSEGLGPRAARPFSIEPAPRPAPTCSSCGTVARRRGSGSSSLLMSATAGALRPYSSGTVTPTLWMRLSDPRRGQRRAGARLRVAFDRLTGGVWGRRLRRPSFRRGAAWPQARPAGQACRPRCGGGAPADAFPLFFYFCFLLPLPGGGSPEDALYAARECAPGRVAVRGTKGEPPCLPGGRGEGRRGWVARGGLGRRSLGEGGRRGNAM